MKQKMKMKIQDGVVSFDSSDTRDEFLGFLRKLASDDPLIRQAIIPIIEHEGIIPDADMSFTELVRNLGTNIHKVPERIFALWNKMHGQTSDPTSKHVMNTRQAADYTKRDPSTMARLAHTGIIPATKIKGRWQFTRRSLNTFLSKHGYLTSARG